MTVELRQVAKRQGAEMWIRDASFTLAKDGFNVLLGATGAGKTTIIKMLAGLEPVTSGAILMDGRDVTRVPTQKRGVSLVHQFFVNYPHMSVRENIASPLKVAGLGAAEIAKRVDEAAAILRLEPYLNRRPSELSGGQQQRTALARAIVKDSALVLLDEPLANLDYKLREELRDQLPKLFAGRGATVVYATSEPSDALMLGGQTICLSEGQVTGVGPTAALYRDPDDVETARVFSDPPINTAEVEKRGDDIRMGATRLPAVGPMAGAPDGPYRLAIRPHHVTPDTAAALEVEVAGTVQITELSGSESTAHFEFDGRSWVSQSHGVHPYRVGEPHSFRIDVAGCFWFRPDGTRVRG